MCILSFRMVAIFESRDFLGSNIMKYYIKVFEFSITLLEQHFCNVNNFEKIITAMTIFSPKPH